MGPLFPYLRPGCGKKDTVGFLSRTGFIWIVLSMMELNAVPQAGGGVRFALP